MLRDEVKDLFVHSFRSYMEKAYPMDELRPLTCKGVTQKQTAGRMLTLVDTLDTLAVMGLLARPPTRVALRAMTRGATGGSGGAAAGVSPA